MLQINVIFYKDDWIKSEETRYQAIKMAKVGSCIMLPKMAENFGGKMFRNQKNSLNRRENNSKLKIDENFVGKTDLNSKWRTISTGKQI